jgi:hypothetical protein
MRGSGAGTRSEEVEGWRTGRAGSYIAVDDWERSEDGSRTTSHEKQSQVTFVRERKTPENTESDTKDPRRAKGSVKLVMVNRFGKEGKGTRREIRDAEI